MSAFVEEDIMKALSTSTFELDPYRAGVEIADSLAIVEPEVIFLFSSIEFYGAAEFLQAIYDALRNERRFHARTRKMP